MWDKKHLMTHSKNIGYLLNNLTLAFLYVDGYIRVSPLMKPQTNLYHWLLLVSKSKIACYIPPPSRQMYKWCRWTPSHARFLHHFGQLLFTFKRHHDPMWVKWLTFSIAWGAPLGLFVGHTWNPPWRWARLFLAHDIIGTHTRRCFLACIFGCYTIRSTWDLSGS